MEGSLGSKWLWIINKDYNSQYSMISNNYTSSDMAFNMNNYIPINLTIHIDRIQITILDYGFNVLSKLMESFEHNNIRRLFRFYENCNLKLQYIKYPHPDNPFSTLIIHDVNYGDQILLIELLQNSRYWLRQIEFAWDIYPENKSDLFDVYYIIIDGLMLIYARVDCYRCVKWTKYWTKKGKIKDGVKGIRFYPKPKQAPYEFVRLELQANKPLIDRLHLKLPVAPDAINPFTFIEYRRGLEIDKMTDLIFKKEKRFHKESKRYGFALVKLVISNWVDCQIIGEHRLTLYEEDPALASQVSNLKKDLPEFRHRLDHLFPKWQGKKEQLLTDIQNGFIRRSYD